MVSKFLKRLFGTADPAKSTDIATLLVTERAAHRAQIAELQADLDDRQLRFDLVRHVSGEGLWDVKVNIDDPTGRTSPFRWSAQFRHLVGYSSERDFPNVLSSWSNLLHPDDKDRTLNALGAHMGDLSGRTPYEVSYRLKCKDGTYRHFRARAETARRADGSPLRVAGSLIPIDDDLKRQRELDVASTRLDDTPLPTVGVLAAVDDIKHREQVEASQQRCNDQMEVALKATAEVVNTIQQIARQTQLIALSAAVEAVRANQADRGSAVNAPEVRSRSARTGDATNDITQIQSELLQNLNSERQAALH